ncbi:Ig-like domain-containing protein [Gorillibacterium sp. CAU 1737]|uniref:Ig-like domain-containing protein n=1 Tax=Gorillibacterium sp. CAU 1737 TaxID=3140362 RepID=UPI003260AFC6
MKATRYIALLLTVVLTLTPFSTLLAAESTLSKLVVSKNEVRLEVGDSVTLSSTAVYTDASTSVVTLSSSWSSDNPSVATVYNGTISAKSEGTAIIVASYKDQSQSVQVTVTKKVKSLTKSKQKLELRLLEKATVQLTATYSDNSTEEVSGKADWSTSDDEVATVVNGTVTAVGSGSAVLTAKLGSQTATIPVDVELVKRLDLADSQLSLLLKEKQTLELTATYPDGTTRNVATDADWSSSDPSIADAIRGAVTAYKAGTATITASYGGKSTTIKVDVDATSKLEVVGDQKIFLHGGDKKQLKLTATYPNGTSSDVTSLATWSTSNEDTVSVIKGYITAGSSGTAAITATYGSKKITLTVDVDVARFLEPSSDSFSMKAKETSPVTLTATYLNGTKENVTTKATWSSSKEEVAYADNGTIYSLSQGEAKLTATYGGKSVAISVDVEVPRTLKLDEKTLALGTGETYQAKVLAIFADGHEEDVTSKATWTSSSAAVADVSSAGLITSASSGTTAITAKYGAKSVNMTVNVALASKLNASVRTLFLNLKESKQIKLTATDSAGKTIDVTSDAEWKAANIKIADVSEGWVTGYARGTTTVTAKYGGKSVVVSVDVDVVQRLEANKRSLTMKSGDDQQLTLTVTFSDGSKKDVTADAEWTTSSYKIADVSPAGLVKATGYGKANITAKYGSKTVTVPVDVDTLKYLQTEEVNVTLTVGARKQVVATATYADGTEADVSKPALWSSSKDSVVTVKDGLLRATGKGKATVTVSYAGKKAKVNVTVQ